jgi:uncharacterized protein YukE
MADVNSFPILVHADLANAGPWLTSAAQAIADELNQLKQQLAPLAADWTLSKAADYYEGLQQEWNVAAEGLFGPEGVLGQIAHALNVNWDNYSEAEWSNIRTWQH